MDYILTIPLGRDWGCNFIFMRTHVSNSWVATMPIVKDFDVLEIVCFGSKADIHIFHNKDYPINRPTPP